MYNKGNHQKHKENRNRYMRQYQRNKKMDVINHYGGKCLCCGESFIEFLAIDHIGGGGQQHRKKSKITSGTGMYRWIVKNNYPTGFRVLCHNCNMSIGSYGYCPHGNLNDKKLKEDEKFQLDKPKTNPLQNVMF